MNKVNILGVEVDNLSLNEAADIVLGWLEKGGKHYIVTPNPEFIMAAQNDIEFKKVLNAADLKIPDGVGLKLAGDIESIIPGIDLMESLCKEAADYGFTTGFLGGQNGVAKKTSERLQKKYPKLRVVFVSDGPRVDREGNELIANSYEPEAISHKLQAVDILFVAFGQVKQEKWIAKNLDKIPVKVAMGVGGAFDYLSGNVTRAPRWIRKIGLEWLFRLIMQPWRIKRQFQLLKFVFLVWTKK